MKTVNDNIYDRSVSHSIWLERYKTGLSNRVIELLNKAEQDILDRIAARLSRIDERGYDIGPATTKRLNELLEMIRESKRKTYNELYAMTRDDLRDFAVYEAGFQARLITEAAVPVVAIDMAVPQRSVLNAAVTSKPFQGRLLREWYSGLATQDARRVSDAVNIGIVEGQTTDQIIRRIRGTRARNYQDGILRVARNDIDSVVKTAVAHVASRAKEDLYAANSNLMLGEQWVSVLDARTTVGCAALDGRIFKVGEGPKTPRHFRCRSIRIAYFGQTTIKGTRASAFGPVPESVTYQNWLKRQPVAIQNEVLGVKKAQLFRKGDLPLDRFVDSSGNAYTLDELRVRDNAVWDAVF